MGNNLNFSPEIGKRGITTTFNKKALGGAILTLFMGFLLWVVPFFVLATETQIYWDISPEGVVDVPFAEICPIFGGMTADGLAQSAKGIYPSETDVRWGAQGYCQGLGSDLEHNNAGDGDYWFFIADFNPWKDPLYWGQYRRTGGVWSIVLPCANYENYTNCVNAGCDWYYSEWMETSGLYPYEGCVDHITPEPEECGSFFKCVFCETQETCSANFCEWKDIGFGNKCYMYEPITPPLQGGWEVPALEDCEVLSGVEKWLCNIKNFIAGIFMPTQAKINEFYMTMGTFKDKFPFNYARALNGFFADIKEGFDTEKNIPVKILGQTGNVNFAFWGASSTIGGVPENLGNIVKDVSTVIILLAFLVWLISFIKRFL
jgi:hypothetical protein